MNFCPSCGSNTRNNPSTQSGQIRPLHRGGARGSNRGYRGRGTGRGELAHIGGIKTRTRELFLKTTPEKKKMVFKLVSIAT